MKERFSYTWFDVFRFLAATAVVLEHARDLFWQPARVGGFGAVYKVVYFLTGFGHEAVMVFFVLSGFWISSTVDRKMHRPDFWPSYLVDRIVRLEVVVIPALVIGGLLDAIGAFGLHGPLYTGNSGAQTMTYAVASRLQPQVFFGNILFLQTLAVETFGSNGPLWSLANEFWYYMWYPALMILAVRRRVSLLLASLLVAVLWPKLLLGFAVWLMGSALYRLDKHKVLAARIGRPAKWGLCALMLILSLISAGASRLQILPEMSADLVVGLCFTGLFWSLLLLDPKVPGFARALGRYGAGSSFSLYVVHFPFAALVAAFLLRGQRLMPGLTALLVLGVVVLAALAYGWIFSRWTEGRTPLVRAFVKARLTPAPESLGGQ
ncbi:acyltransferase [Novosphingobium profundi]|uniref:acyltransferase family protein n=1 Tax=Novosphingobium profundi TaxID=1774954 RepID=UPI001BD96093|nr:acyltransferase [Novosphingobium profundi]